jgi:hypothetical protein
MKTGRVPVILSDEWIPPKGPSWETFSLRVPESDIFEVPSMLESLELQAPEMGKRARHTWEEWFAPEVSFHRVIDWCLDIKDSRPLPESVGSILAYLQLMHPYFAKQLARDVFGNVKTRAKQLVTS